MDWTVIVKKDSLSGTYEVSAERYYQAKVAGITLFLKENKIPGKPYLYLTAKKNELEVEVRTKVDRRVGERPLSSNEYFMEQIDNLLTSIRTSTLGDKCKDTASEFLQRAKEVISVG